jgi:hypothetical protein
MYQTHSHKAKKEKALWPIGGGGNFVDLTLWIVVKQATGTLMAFQPEFPLNFVVHTTGFALSHSHPISWQHTKLLQLEIRLIQELVLVIMMVKCLISRISD